MNFLKSYKLFESSDLSDIIDDVNEILLELNDEGFDCKSTFNLKEDEIPPVILRNIPDGYKLVKTHDFIYIEFSRSSPGFTYEDIKNVYYRIKEYLSMNGWVEEGDFEKDRTKDTSLKYKGAGNMLYTVCKFKKPLG